MYHVYTLTDPRTNQIYYVGKSNNVERRYLSHLSEKCGKSKVAWVQELKGLGLLPKLEVIDTTETDEEVQVREAYWINHYLSLGMPLTNYAGILRAATVSKRRVPDQNITHQSVHSGWVMLETFCTPEEAATFLGIARCTVLQYLREKKLRGYQLDEKAWRITVGDLNRFMEERDNQKKK